MTGVLPQISSWGFSPALGERRILRAGKWLPARSLGWMLFLIFAIMLAFGPTVEALSHQTSMEPPFRFLVKAIGAVIVLGSYAFLVKIGEDRSPSELDILAVPAGLFAGFIVGFAMFAIVMAIAVGCRLYD